jgi:hypothetical protein
MTGYQSKKAAAQDKLAQPEQEALKLALEALKEIARHATTPWEDEWCGELADETLTAINALAQPEQEPVEDATMQSLKDLWRSVCDEVGKAAFAQPAQEPLTCQGRQCQACETNGFKHSPECIVDTAKEQGWSNAPPAAQRPWVDLTPDEIGHQAKKSNHEVAFALGAFWADAKLKEKNNE